MAFIKSLLCLFFIPSYIVARAYPDTPITGVVISDTSKKLSPSEKLYRAIHNDSAEEVRTAVKAGIDIKQPLHRAGFPDGNAPLVNAVLFSKCNAVKALLELGADPNQAYWGPSILGGGDSKIPVFRLLDYAVLVGDVKTALAFVKAGAKFGHNISRTGSGTNIDIINDMNIMGYVLAYYNQDPSTCYELVKELFAHGYKKIQYQHDINPERINVWCLALNPGAYSGIGSGAPALNKELIDLFIANGYDIDQTIMFPNGDRLTPLAFAVRDRQAIEPIKLLLEASADPNKPLVYQNKLNQSIIQFLKTFQQFSEPTMYNQILQLLRDHGAKESLYDI